MKIGILTQPIHTNYGGALQAYALHKVLRDMGHEVWLVRREPYLKMDFDYWIRTNLGNIIRYIRHQPLRRWTWLGPKQEPSREIVEQHIQAFVNKNITHRTGFIYNTEGLIDDLNVHKYEAYIVGSDQVWRPRFNDTNQRNFWLDFLDENTKILRIAYAASFGTNQWEYKDKLQKDCRELAHRFDSISVREESGISLLKDHFGVTDVKHVLDPTLLLSREDYKNIIKENSFSVTEPTIFSYLLDFQEQNIQLISEIAQEKGLKVRTVRPQKRTSEYFKGDNLDEFIIPPVTEWLKAFVDASYVITDSFHGTVFSIIFNKPFVTLANGVRGVARLESLLREFGLEKRFVTVGANENIKDVLEEKIDWQSVNIRHNELRTASITYLKNALKK